MLGLKAARAAPAATWLLSRLHKPPVSGLQQRDPFHRFCRTAPRLLHRIKYACTLKYCLTDAILAALFFCIDFPLLKELGSAAYFLVRSRPVHTVTYRIISTGSTCLSCRQALGVRRSGGSAVGTHRGEASGAHSSRRIAAAAGADTAAGGDFVEVHLPSRGP